MKKWIKKYKKDLALVTGAILAVVIAVLGWHWTETSDRPFWWNFWVVAAVVCDVGLFIVWAILWSKDRRER